MVGMLLDKDPALALRHAKAAKKRAGRLQVVREAMAEAAYAAEDFRTALAEYQVLRRMSGNDNFLPVMADCQRAAGKPMAALELLGQADLSRLSPEQRVEAVLVAAGARQDLGQAQEAQRLLQSAIENRQIGAVGQSRLRYALAALLESGGDKTGARQWYESSADADPASAADAKRRLAMLDGLPVPDEDEDDDEDDFAIDEVWDDDDDDDAADGDEGIEAVWADEYEDDEVDEDESDDGEDDAEGDDEDGGNHAADEAEDEEDEQPE